jgi:hypothetical protein
MSAHPIGSRSSRPSQWYVPSPTCNRAYMVAGVIALLLLGILAVIVLF